LMAWVICLIKLDLPIILPCITSISLALSSADRLVIIPPSEQLYTHQSVCSMVVQVFDRIDDIWLIG